MPAKHLFFATIFIGTSFLGYHLHARDLLASVPVLDRRFEEFTPKGFSLGRFQVNAGLGAGASYTSNVFRSDRDEISDKIITYGGSVNAVGSYNIVDLDFSADVEKRDFLTVDDWDQVNFSSDLKADIDLSKNIDLILQGRKIRSHQTFSENPIPTDVYDPVAVDENRFFTELILKPANTQLSLSAQYRDLSYEDTQLNSNNTTLIQRDRDRQIFSASARLSKTGYSGNDGPRLIPFMGLSLSRSVYDRRDFDVITNDFTGVDQDVTSYSALAGIEFQPTGKLRGEAGIGFGISQPDADTRDESQNFLVDIDLTYLYTPLTNFVFNAKRFFGTDNGNSEVILETDLSAEVIHELTRRWILNAGIGYNAREFANDIEDSTWSFSTGATYRVNDHYAIQGDVRFFDRESNKAGGDFDETRAMIRVKRNF